MSKESHPTGFWVFCIQVKKKDGFEIKVFRLSFFFMFPLSLAMRVMWSLLSGSCDGYKYTH